MVYSYFYKVFNIFVVYDGQIFEISSLAQQKECRKNIITSDTHCKQKLLRLFVFVSDL